MPFDNAAFVYHLEGATDEDGPFLVCFRDESVEVYSAFDCARLLDRYQQDGMESYVNMVARPRWSLADAQASYKRHRQPLIHYKTEPSRN